jgi:hypothetical protein
MKVNDKTRSVRMISAAQTTKMDWSKVKILESNIPQLCGVKDENLSLDQQCQEVLFAEEIH